MSPAPPSPHPQQAQCTARQGLSGTGAGILSQAQCPGLTPGLAHWLTWLVWSAMAGLQAYVTGSGTPGGLRAGGQTLG